MEIIEIDQWARKEIYDLFSSKMNPFYTLSFNLDVTNVYGFAKRNGLSFYSCLAYLCTKALNSVDEFLLQIKDGKIVRFKERQPGLTMLDRETKSSDMSALLPTAPSRNSAEGSTNRMKNRKRFSDPAPQTMIR